VDAYDGGASALVLLGMALFVIAVYTLVVRGGGAVLGVLDRPHLGLSVLATAVVALGFERVRQRLRQVALRLVRQDLEAPYELLTGFHPKVVDTDEVPARMARLLAEAAGAQAAQVVLSVNRVPVPVATWAPGRRRPGTVRCCRFVSGVRLWANWS
jgi:hypothetical protein